jgi:hypothetical protein
MGFFSRLKKLKTKTLSEKLLSLTTGDCVLVKFIDPTLMGYVNASDAVSRFDTEDLKTNSLIGQVTWTRRDPVMDSLILEVISLKTNGNLRTQIFIENEITDIILFTKE